MALNDLYQQVIMKHYKEPAGFGAIPDRCEAVSRENPACGDRLKIALRQHDDTIEDLLIEGSGCAISVASCSLMTLALRGKTLAEARRLALRFLETLRSPSTPFDETSWGEIAALEAVKRYPGRISCAELGWKILLDILPAHGDDPAN